MTKSQKKKLCRIGASALLFLAGVLAGKVFRFEIGEWVFCIAAYLLAGWDVLKEAVEGILHGQVFDENFLMAIASIGAICIGEPMEAAAVIILYQIGEWFQGYAVNKSRKSISDLMDIKAETATVERNGATEVVDPEEVAIGETVIVKAGEKVPVDGIVLDGVSSLDTSALTGESVPRSVKAGDEIIGGCINQTGLLRIQSTKEYEDSTVARILELVETASDKKAHMENFITRFARIYTPVVCGAALLLFLVPSLITGSWIEWLTRALSFLVVSCPCALVISVPLSFFGGIGAAGKNGILIKGSNYMEALAKTSTVVFDKTGTLTKGVFQVSVVHPETLSEKELVCIAASVEAASDHPIAQSIRACDVHDHTPAELTDVKEEAGMGITASYNGHRISVGNEKLMNSLGLTLNHCPHSGTVVHVAMDGVYHGHIVISDEIKEHSAEAIASLKKSGVKKTVMLTGDRAEAAQAVAESVGIDEVHANLLPENKVAEVEKLLSSKPEGTSLAFVGDGINDAPVLMRADVGVAMGALGSDAAIEAADVVLMDDNPAKLANAIRISKKTISIARQNIIFALAVKVLILILAAFGIADMWLAIFGDVGVCTLAILNAMRTLKMK